MNKMCKLGTIATVTKLAGFEYTKYLSGNFISNGVPVLQGRNIKNNKLNYEEVKFITSQLSNSLIRSKVNYNDILFCYVANVGDSWLNKESRELHLGSNIAKITITDNAIPEYLYYWLQSPLTKKMISSKIKGTVQKNINMKDIRDFNISIPNLDFQQHIVDNIWRLPNVHIQIY